MAFYTIISIVIALFGACQAIMSALRSHSDADLKSKVADCKKTHDELAGMLNGGDHAKSSKDDYARLKDTAEKSFEKWRRALMWPTWCFSVIIVFLFGVIELISWTDQNGKPLEVPSYWVPVTKSILGVYFFCLIYFTVSLIIHRRRIEQSYQNLSRFKLTALNVQPAATVKLIHSP